MLYFFNEYNTVKAPQAPDTGTIGNVFIIVTLSNFTFSVFNCVISLSVQTRCLFIHGKRVTMCVFSVRLYLYILWKFVLIVVL